MAGAVNQIKAFIQTYLNYDFSTLPKHELEELRDFISNITLRLRWEIEDTYSNCPNETAKADYVAYVQSQLIFLSNHLSESNEGKSLFSAVAIPGIFIKIQVNIFHILEYMRINFTDYFQFSSLLPANFVTQMKSETPIFETVVNKAAAAGADPALVMLISNFSYAALETERFKLRTWRQWDFCIKTILVFDQFLDQISDKDVDLQLLKLFICRDFNSIQVYAYFLKYVERITNSDDAYQEQKQELLYLAKVFQQVRVENPHPFNPKVQDLKTSVLEGLNAEISFLEEKHQLLLQSFRATNPESPSKFYFTVNTTLADLMFFLRILLETGFIQTKFNSYLYEFVRNHIRTKNAENISKKSQRNLFNNKPFPDKVVNNMRAWLAKMISHLDLYYKPNY